jgi:hypothetical protein
MEKQIATEKVLGITNRLLSFDTTLAAWKATGPKTLLLLCIRCRGNVFTEPLPSKNRIHIQAHRLMGRIYEIRRWDGMWCHDILTKFHKDWFKQVGIHRHTDSMVTS